MTSSAPPASADFAPFLIAPHFDPRIWGYRDLRPWYNVTAGDEPIGEVWLTGDQCRVASGSHAGKTLGQFFAEFPAALIGSTAHPGSPLLMKIIFAREKLSVQVHPDDTMAHKYGEPRGKTECWYTLDAEPGAAVALGLKPGVSMAEVRAGIQDGTLENSLNRLPVAKGDMVFVDAGTVHAIWPGAILFETQQYSDTTYRMYDYGRPRELHLDKSFEAMRLKTRAGKIPPRTVNGHSVLIDEKYFEVERWPLAPGKDSSAITAGTGGLQILFVAEGQIRISADKGETFPVNQCELAVIPACSRNVRVHVDSKATVIRIQPRTS